MFLYNRIKLLIAQYLDFDNLPETNFSCQGKVIGGYYADVEAGCQMFHVCTIGQKGNARRIANATLGIIHALLYTLSITILH